jgi:hypothetical protein
VQAATQAVPATMIESCAVAGCNQQPTTLVAASSKLGSFTVAGLAVNDTRVYWSNLDGVWACPKTACVTPTLMFPQKHPGLLQVRRQWVCRAAHGHRFVPWRLHEPHAGRASALLDDARQHCADDGEVKAGPSATGRRARRIRPQRSPPKRATVKATSGRGALARE